MYRVGIIGCGGITERRHAPTFSALERTELVALADLSEERLELLGERHGVGPEHRYTDYQRMLEREELDLVSIATPHSAHEEQAIAAAQSGVHVVLEKPIARTVEEVDRMARAAEEAGVRLTVAHNQLYLPQVLESVRLLRSGELGRAFLVRSEGLSGSTVWGRGVMQDWRTKKEAGGGGPLIDSGYHQVYRALAWLGSPVKRVFARIGTHVMDIEVEDMALLLMEHANGGTTSLQIGWCARGGATGMEEVYATEGQLRVRMGGDEPLSVWRASTEQWENASVKSEPDQSFGLPTLVNGFLDAIESGGPVPVSADDARDVLQVIQGAYQSAQRGEAVELAP